MSIYVAPYVFNDIEDYMKHDNRAYNQGKIWNSACEQAALRLFDHGCELFEICKLVCRTPLGVLERLKKYGRVRHDSTTGDWLRCIDTGICLGVSNTTTTWANNPYTTIANTATNITLKESNTMTKPLEHKAFLFGNDIAKLSETSLINHIKQASEEINSYASIPDNKYTKMRIANLQDAIEAAVKELNKRGE